MTWDILIVTIPRRDKFLAHLLMGLLPQVSEFPDVRVTWQVFDKGRPLGLNRQDMLASSNADFVCFVDDDDSVAPDYVRRIRPMLENADYVGFQVQGYVNEKPQAPTFHSTRYSGWSDDDFGYYRDFSHLNPIKREISLLAAFEGGAGEDRRWADRVRALGLVKRENYIDAVMYHYFYRTHKDD